MNIHMYGEQFANLLQHDLGLHEQWDEKIKKTLEEGLMTQVSSPGSWYLPHLDS